MKYTCEMCNKTYKKEWSDKEALAETESYFGKGWKQEDLAIVCDDCWNKIHPNKHPELVKRVKR